MLPVPTDRYPHLSQEADWGFARVQFALCGPLPPAPLISNVNLVPFIGDSCVVIHVHPGRWEIPGGTSEPGEPYLDTLRRELLEEAGARLLTFTPLGAWRCLSAEAAPFRPHMPHPEFYRLVGWGAVELVGVPHNPPDAEQVLSVELVTPEEAGRRFRASQRPDLADLYRLAADARAAAAGG